MAALLLALSGWLYLEHVDPRYDGRRASEWLRALTSDYPGETKDAELAIFMLGERAIPQISRFYFTREIEWQEQLLEWIADKTDWKIERGVADDMRHAGQSGVAILGKRAAEMLPKLIESLADEEFEDASRLAIESIGEIANARLKSALKHSNDRVRIQVIRILVERKQADIIPQLKEFLTSENLELRALTIESLVALGLPKDEALPLLMPLLKEKDSRARISAINAIGALAEINPEMSPEFLAHISDTDMQSRLMVVQRLHRFDPAIPAVTDTLIAGLKDSDGVIQKAALKELSIQFTGGYIGSSILKTGPTYEWSWDFKPKREVKFSGTRLYPRADEFLPLLKAFAGKSSEIGASGMVLLLFFDPKLRPLTEEMLVLIDKSERLEKEDHQAHAKINTEIEAHLIKLNNVDTNMSIPFLRMVVRFMAQQDRYLLPR